MKLAKNDKQWHFQKCLQTDQGEMECFKDMQIGKIMSKGTEDRMGIINDDIYRKYKEVGLI